MPLYRAFSDVLAEQTEDNYKDWLKEMQRQWKKAYLNEQTEMRICAKTARNAYDAGMTPYECLSEKHYD